MSKEKIFIIVGVLIISLNFSYASEIENLKASIDKKNDELAKIEAEIEIFNRQILEAGKEADSLKKSLNQLALSKKKLLAEIKATQSKINIANSTIQKLNSEISGKEKKISSGLAAMGESIKNVNNLENETLVSILLSGKKLSQVWNDIDNLSSLSNSLNNYVEEVRELKQELESNKNQKEAERKKLVSLRVGLSDREKIVVNNQREKDKLLKETKNKEANYQKILADRLAKKDKLEQEILEFEGKLKITVDTSKLPRTGSGVLSWPLDKITITQYFGRTPFATINPQVYNGKGHNGVDFRASIGTRVYSAADGRIIGTGDTDMSCDGVSYGKWILIEHTNGLATLYAHLELIRVSAGDNVLKGEIVGYSGNTGYSTGPHVHFAVFASQAVRISAPTEYRSKICGTYMRMPISPLGGYLNPMSYL